MMFFKLYDVLDKYQIVEVLFQAGFVQFYRVKNIENQRFYLIKTLAADEYNTPANFECLLQEGHVVEKLRNAKFILPYIETILLDKTPVLIYEDFPACQLLSDCIPQNGFEISKFLTLAIQLARGLNEIHQGNIIYKAVSPSHILIDIQNNVLKYCNFSHASALLYEKVQWTERDAIYDLKYYASPEQTGRTNSMLDYRADFYSLGMTFYQLLTGILPFQVNSTVFDIIYQQLTKSFQPVHEIQTNIPLLISDIVAKLLSKNVEDRYQSAEGLLYDLESCQAQFQQSQAIVPFVLGSHDIPARFQISQKVYGRQEEMKIMNTVFERVNQGSGEVLLVAGSPGIGKTTFVQEINTAMLAYHALFIEAKFQCLFQNIPYGINSLLGVSLLKQLPKLAVSQKALCEQLLKALGDDAEVFLNFSPKIRQLVGKESVVLDINEAERIRRLYQAIHKFLQFFATIEHPVIIFLDDLQWADSQTLQTLSKLFEAPFKHLLLICAYRDNELYDKHPTQQWIDGLVKQEVPVTTIKLSPLTFIETNQFIADSMRCDMLYAQDLSRLLYQVTQGNPFDTKLLIQDLYDQKQIILVEQKQMRWQLRSMKWLLENVPDIITALQNKVKQLNNEQRYLLKLITAFGKTERYCTLDILTIILSHQSREVTLQLLQTLQECGIIQQTEQHFHFIHDKIRSIVLQMLFDSHAQTETKSQYSSLIDSQIYLQIGRALMKGNCQDNVAIVEHMNAAYSLIDSLEERLTLAKINLNAAHQIKLSGAYNKYAEYLEIARDCLGEQQWKMHQDLNFQIFKHLVEAYFLLNQYDKAESLIKQVIEHTNKEQTADVITTLIVIYTMQGRFQKALETGTAVLSSLNIHLSTDNLQYVLPAKLAQIERILCSKLSTESLDNITSLEQFSPLLHLPKMQSEKAQVINFLFASLCTPAYISKSPLYPIIMSEWLRLILIEGLMPNASKAFANYFTMVCAKQKKYARGYAAGKLGIQIAERFNAKTELCQACFFFNLSANHWVRPLREAHDILQLGYQAGLSAGDWQFTSYLRGYLYSLNPFFQGDNLSIILTSTQTALGFYHEKKSAMVSDATQNLFLIINNLLGKTSALNVFETEQITEEKYLKACYASLTSSSFHLSLYYVFKAQVMYLYGCYEVALKNAELAKPLLAGIIGTYHTAEHNFYTSLALIACFKTASLEVQAEYLQQIKDNQKDMELWAQSCPENFRHKWLLVKAELAQIENKLTWHEIIDCYDQAIELANQNRFTQDAALANERAARFLLSFDRKKCARPYLRDAYFLYQRWGVVRKVTLLEDEFSDQLRQSISPAESNESSPNFLLSRHFLKTPLLTSPAGKILDSPLEQFNLGQTWELKGDDYYFDKISPMDLRTTMDAAQVFATEPQLKDLLPKIMHIIVKNAGAQRALLFLNREGELFVQAVYEQDAAHIQVLQEIPSRNTNHYAHSIVETVQRTAKEILLHHAEKNAIWQEDTYIAAHNIKSLLCMPIRLQRKLVGILYLENNITDNVFTRNRIALLQLLSSLVAIALENAERHRKELELQQTLETRIAERTQALQESEHHFRAILNMAPVGIFESNAQGVLLSINQYFLQLIGVKLSDSADSLDTQVEELLSNKSAKLKQIWQDAVHPEDVERVAQAWYNAIKTQQPFNTEYRFCYSNGKIVWFFLNVKPIFDDHGVIKSWIGTLSDITQQKQLKEEEKEKERQLLSRFVRNICHEIRNPLYGITGNLSLVKEDIAQLKKMVFNDVLATLTNFNMQPYFDLTKSITKKLNDMLISSNHQQAILDKVLVFHRFNAGEEKATLIPMKLNDIVNDVIATLSGTATQKGLTIKSRFSPNESIFIKSDPDQLKRVLINFLSNGIKYSDQGGVTILTRIQNQTTERITLTIEVKDTGRGMTADQINHVGKLFWRGESDQPGTGIGIAISKNILEMLGGKLFPVKSTLNQGSTFGFELTCDNLSLQEIGILKEENDQSNTPHELSVDTPKPRVDSTLTSTNAETANLEHFVKILVVDDDEMIRNVLVNSLTAIFQKTPELKKYTLIIETAENGKKAVKKFLTADPSYHIILMDIWMLGIDGLETTKLIRVLEKDSPSKVHIIGLSGHALEEDKAQAIQAGMDNYIIKPAKHTLLKQVILDYLFPEALLSQSKSSLFIKTELTPIEESSEQKSKSPAAETPKLNLI